MLRVLNFYQLGQTNREIHNAVASLWTMPEHHIALCVVFTTFTHTAPSGKPGEFHVHHRTPTSAQLSWTPIPKDQQNGIITGYTVQVVGPDFTREISITDATTTSTEVIGLRPITSYYFSISATTVAGTGPPARSFSITHEGGKVCELCTCAFISEGQQKPSASSWSSVYCWTSSNCMA